MYTYVTVCDVRTFGAAGHAGHEPVRAQRADGARRRAAADRRARGARRVAAAQRHGR